MKAAGAFNGRPRELRHNMWPTLKIEQKIFPSL
jgi:hypothetical protein